MINIAIIQLRTELDQDETLEKAAALVREAAAKGAELVVLPEMWSCPYSKGYFKKYAVLGHERAWAAMSSWARELGIYLVGGSVPEAENGRLYNSCFVFNDRGEQIARHRKVHLFDVDLPGMSFKESDTFDPGEEITVFDTPWGKMGCAICFDLRFPELFRAMALKGAKLIFLPAQFNMKTGPAHWELSLRARAVDCQVFVAAAAAARYEGFDYECWGHSMLVDPYGIILAQADEKEQILYSQVDLGRIEEVRSMLPTSTRLRSDVYRLPV